MANSERNMRASRIGTVMSNAMDKTVVVKIERRFPHPLYKRIITRSEKVKAHDEANDCSVGDIVKIMATRPISKAKRWRVSEVMERAK